ncbi:MAG TPA: 4-phosphoerythronate dehydrogenase PdxB [Verrucomicrobiae bacterium]|nr:4-phosphoerythronate dehydrogenase PdxB [Verrucomicrobiae bacterium]
MKIVADPNIPFVREAFASLGDIVLVPGRQIDAAAAGDADALLVRSVTPVNARLLDGSRVRFVATATIGTDHVDEPCLRERGIGFASAAGSNANSVAEYVVAALLEMAHRHGFRLRDQTLGVVGVGNVGSRVVRYAEALGMRVLPNDPPRQRAENLPQFVPLPHVLTGADIITLHVPLTRRGVDATAHLFDKERLAALEERRPLLINTARGAIVDNKALLKAIDGERVRGTVLDVWENEPDISPELLDVVDIGTPHIAGYSFDGKVNGTQMIYRAACQFFGIPPTWQPPLPPPEVPRIELSVSSGDDDDDVLRRVVRRVYDVTADDAALRKGVRSSEGLAASFDTLRAVYPVRREFFNTELILRGASDTLRKKFATLEFKPVLAGTMQ